MLMEIQQNGLIHSDLRLLVFQILVQVMDYLVGEYMDSGVVLIGLEGSKDLGMN